MPKQLSFRCVRRTCNKNVVERPTKIKPALLLWVLRQIDNFTKLIIYGNKHENVKTFIILSNFNYSYYDIMEKVIKYIEERRS